MWTRIDQRRASLAYTILFRLLVILRLLNPHPFHSGPLGATTSGSYRLEAEPSGPRSFGRNLGHSADGSRGCGATVIRLTKEDLCKSSVLRLGRIRAQRSTSTYRLLYRSEGGESDIEGDRTKAARFREIGGPEVLRIEDVDKPKPGAGQALVKVHVVGVNFADTLLRRGAYISQPNLPETPGYEAAGIVEEVGPGVDSKLVGQRVVALAEHCYAEYVAAPANGLIPLPDAVSFETGAAFPVQALTAYHMLFTVDKVDARKTVLVHAAAGGVGLVAIQMAKLAGAHVFGTTSSQDKARLPKEMGADEVILYNETKFAQEVHRLTGGRGVDLVLDSVGKATQEGSSTSPYGSSRDRGEDPPHPIIPRLSASLFSAAMYLSA